RVGQAHSRAHDRDHPYCVSLWIADVRDHLIEISHRLLTCDWGQFADGPSISVAPCFDDGSECFARHAHRIHDDVIHCNLMSARMPKELRPMNRSVPVADPKL